MLNMYKSGFDVLRAGLMVEEDSDHISSLSSLLSNPTWRHQLHLTHQLAYCDLDLLTSNPEKLCFYVNLHNLMVLHAWFYATEREHEEKEDLEEVYFTRILLTQLKHFRTVKMAVQHGKCGSVTILFSFMNGVMVSNLDMFMLP